jgi:transposase-like protein
MTDPRMTLLDLLAKSEQGADPSFLRDGLRLLSQEFMDAEVTQLIGAGPYERTEQRTTSRNGYRDREWDTRDGTIELQIPKLSPGHLLPEPARATAPP